MTTDPAVDNDDSGSLPGFVVWLVDTYELWTRIPQCWAEHPQVIEEMRVLQAFYLWTEEAAAVDPSQGATGRASWHDYLARVLARLADGPDATCAKARSHRVPQTWDDDEWLARKAAQRAG